MQKPEGHIKWFEELIQQGAGKIAEEKERQGAARFEERETPAEKEEFRYALQALKLANSWRAPESDSGTTTSRTSGEPLPLLRNLLWLAALQKP